MARDISQSYFMNEQMKDNRRYKVDPYAMQQFYKQSDAALEDNKKMIWLASMGLLDTVSEDSDNEAAGKIAYITNRQRYFQPKIPTFAQTPEPEPAPAPPPMPEPPLPEVTYHDPTKKITMPTEEEYEEKVAVPKLQALENYELGDWNSAMSYNEWYNKAPENVRKEIDAFTDFVSKYGADNIGKFGITTGTDATPLTRQSVEKLVYTLDENALKNITRISGHSYLNRDDLIKLWQKNPAKYDKLFQNMLGYKRYENLRGVLTESLKTKGMNEEQIRNLFADYDPMKHQYGKKKYNKAERFSRMGLEGGQEYISIKKKRTVGKKKKRTVGKPETTYYAPNGKEMYKEDPFAKEDLLSNYEREQAIKRGMEEQGYNYKTKDMKKTEEWINKSVKEITNTDYQNKSEKDKIDTDEETPYKRMMKRIAIKYREKMEKQRQGGQ